MSSTSNEISCIMKYIINTSNSHSIKDFLIEENIATEGDFKLASPSVAILAETIYVCLKKALKSNIVSLIYFDWVILPKESIKITITTKFSHREFLFGY